MTDKPLTTRLMLIVAGDIPRGLMDGITEYLDGQGVHAGVMVSWDRQNEAWLALVKACEGLVALHPVECADPDCPAVPAREALALVGRA